MVRALRQLTPLLPQIAAVAHCRYRHLGSCKIRFSGWTEDVCAALTARVKTTSKKSTRQKDSITIPWNAEGEPGSAGQLTIGQYPPGAPTPPFPAILFVC